MLPLSFLRTAQNRPMLVELKNGETYNGHLVSCDNGMNIALREVIFTSRDGDRFARMPECFIRGCNIKYLRIPDEVVSRLCAPLSEVMAPNTQALTVERARFCLGEGSPLRRPFGKGTQPLW